MTGHHCIYDIEANVQKHLDQVEEDVYYTVLGPDPMVGNDKPVAYWCSTAYCRVNLFRLFMPGRRWLAASFVLPPDHDPSVIGGLVNKALASFNIEINARQAKLDKDKK